LEHGEKLHDIPHENNLETLQILITAYPYPQSRQKCEEMVAEYFFDKSTEIHRVVEVLTELTASAQKTLTKMKNSVQNQHCQLGGESIYVDAA
jgi:hypothetical protein